MLRRLLAPRAGACAASSVLRFGPVQRAAVSPAIRPLGSLTARGAPADLWRTLLGSPRSLVSVAEAQSKIFGHPPPEVQASRPMKALRKLKRRGLIGEKVEAYFPKPVPLARHPIVRKALAQAREDRLSLERKLGRSPPKKGQGKGASRKKK